MTHIFSNFSQKMSHYFQWKNHVLMDSFSVACLGAMTLSNPLNEVIYKLIVFTFSSLISLLIKQIGPEGIGGTHALLYVV